MPTELHSDLYRTMLVYEHHSFKPLHHYKRNSLLNIIQEPVPSDINSTIYYCCEELYDKKRNVKTCNVTRKGVIYKQYSADR